ncbi:MAG TPA: adenylate/guanylate cyclase domain-containing protein [Halomicronema sp.]
MSVDFIEHDRYNGSLRRLNQIDATLNKDVFELRYGVLTHYDSLVRGVTEIQTLQKNLKNMPKFMDEQGIKTLNAKKESYQKVQEKKEQLIEKFKSGNALLKNSLYYLPVLATELAQEASNNGDDILAIRINDLLKDVLLYNLTSSEDIAPKIAEKLENFKANKNEYSLRVKDKDLDLMVAHVEVILKNKPEVDLLIQNLVSLPTAQKGEELYKTYNLEYEKALNSSGYYRLLFYMFSIVLISSISAYIILKLRNAATIVNLAKENIQTALEATQEAEKKYRSIFENSTDGIFQTTPEGKYLNANPTLSTIYGYDSPAELIESITNISTQLYVDLNRRAEFINQMTNKGSIAQFESQVYRKDGKIIWISENARSVKDTNGKLLYYEGTVEDITRRKRMETALTESENRLRIQQESLVELAMSKPVYSGDIIAAYREITQNASHTLSVERASIWHYNADKTCLKCINLYQQSLKKHSSGTEILAADFPAYFKAMESDRAIAANYARTDPRTKEFCESYLIPCGITSMLDVPIRVAGRTVGVVCLEQVGKARKWALEEQNFASYLGYIAALSIEASDRKQAQEALRQEQEKVERLILNILPAPIAERLKQNYTSIADHFEEVTVLFADIVGFTQLSAHISPTELVSNLNQIFSSFDKLADRHDLEKIKTIGDAYMVVGGLPMPRKDHAEAIAEMALDMQLELAKLSTEIGIDFKIRIGINTGPVVAGVIGLKKFIYDLWGDTVNTASRMESHGISGSIQVTEPTYLLLRHKYQFQERGIIHVKGKGDMIAYLLTGKQN